MAFKRSAVRFRISPPHEVNSPKAQGFRDFFFCFLTFSWFWSLAAKTNLLVFLWILKHSRGAIIARITMRKVQETKLSEVFRLYLASATARGVKDKNLRTYEHTSTQFQRDWMWIPKALDTYELEAFKRRHWTIARICWFARMVDEMSSLIQALCWSPDSYPPGCLWRKQGSSARAGKDRRWAQISDWWKLYLLCSVNKSLVSTKHYALICIMRVSFGIPPSCKWSLSMLAVEKDHGMAA